MDKGTKVVSKISIAPKGIASQPELREKPASRTYDIQLSKQASLAPCPLHAHRSYAQAQIKFGRRLTEHASWGAAVDAATKDVNFKIPTFVDAKKVFVQIKDASKKGYTPMWAEGLFATHRHPETNEVTELTATLGTKIFELKNKGKGVFEHLVGATEAKHGQEYRFIIVKTDNGIECVKDPYAKKQTHVNGWSEIHDHSTFKWSQADTDWQAGKNKKRLSKQHATDGLLNPENLRIAELHIGTMTKEGTLAAAKKEIERIAKAGYNATQIMPQNRIPGTFGWGYDVSDQHATLDPEGLKEFVDHAHKHGINIIMDYVPNHMGPEGNHLGRTGHFMTGHDTEHGAQFNYEGEHNEHVRDWIVNAAQNWVKDYHVDGIRADMTKLMSSDNTMIATAEELNHHHPKVILIAEDGRFGPGNFGDDPRVTNPLNHSFETEDTHANYIENVVMKNHADTNTLGFDYQYGYYGQKDIMAVVLGSPYKDHPPSIRSLEGSMRSGRILHVGETHDDPFNDDAFGIITKKVANHLNLYDSSKIDFKNPDTNYTGGHRANNIARQTVETVVTGKADEMAPQEWESFQRENHFMQPVPLHRAKEAIEAGIQRKKLHDTILSLSAGPHLKFRHRATYAPNYFFRDLSDPNDVKNLYREKGYRPDTTFEPSKVTSLLGNKNWQRKLIGIDNMNAKLNRLADTIPAMSAQGKFKNSVFHDGSGVLGIHRSDDNGSEIFAVINTSHNSWGNKSYGMDMPQGKWQQVFSTDSKIHAGSGEFENTVVNGGKPNISIPPSGVMIFKKIS